MISNNAIINLGFKPATVKADFSQMWEYHEDKTHLFLRNELGTALYTLHDPAGKQVWQGALSRPATLVRRLLKFGNNLSAAPDSEHKSYGVLP